MGQREAAAERLRRAERDYRLAQRTRCPECLRAAQDELAAAEAEALQLTAGLEPTEIVHF